MPFVSEGSVLPAVAELGEPAQGSFGHRGRGEQPQKREKQTKQHTERTRAQHKDFLPTLSALNSLGRGLRHDPYIN